MTTHSPWGLVSSVCAAAAVALLGRILYLMLTSDSAFDPYTNNVTAAFAKSTRVISLSYYGLVMLGVASGIAGLMQTGRRRLFAVLGTAVCGLLLLVDTVNLSLTLLDI